MNVIIEVENGYHLGDQIINFIFFYKIKDYIEKNNIIIHYYCLPQYHRNLNDFNCSNNIKILNYTHKKGYVLWQGGNTPHLHYIEDKLCNMFNIFLTTHRIPMSVSIFEYEDPDLIERFNALENKYKNIDILIINSAPLSGQYVYNKNEWDDYILKLSKKHSIATSATVNENILSLEKFSVKNIAAVSLNVQIIIAIDTGPSIPLYNKNTLDHVTQIYLFGPSNINIRKIQRVFSLQQLSFLL